MKTDSAVRPVRLPVVWNDSPGRLREAVEVQAVVPVGAADERQAVGAEVVEDVVERALQVLEERRRVLRVVVEGHRLLQDPEVARLLDVGRRPRDEPERVVVEARPDVVVPPLRERLVLVVGAAVRLLGGRDVEDALPRPRRDEVHEAEQVLVRVAEAHAAADAGLEVRGRARHVERDHALVGVPDVDHPVEALVAGLHRVLRQHLRPVLAQGDESGVHLRGRLEAREELPRGLLVHDPRALPLLRHRVLDVAEDEDEGLLLARREGPPPAGASRSATSRWPRSCATSPPPRPAARRSRSRAPGSSRGRCRSRPPSRSPSGRRSDSGAPGTRSCGRSSSRRPRPPRSRGSSGSSSGRPRPPTGRTRRTRRA